MFFNGQTKKPDSKDPFTLEHGLAYFFPFTRFRPQFSICLRIPTLEPGKPLGCWNLSQFAIPRFYSFA